MKFYSFALFLLLSCFMCQSQEGVSETGLWSQYFFNKSFNKNWSVTGDFQYRTFEVTNDFQQFIARAGIGYRPDSVAIDMVAGYAYFHSGAFGESDATTGEHRLHQDLWFASNVSTRFELKHRVRIEERFIDDQDFRSRFRYTLFVNIPLNNKTIQDKTLYVALWNELFINGETDTGLGSVEYFDRNWAFAGLGYKFNGKLKAQAGYMREVTPSASKGQLVISLFQTF